LKATNENKRAYFDFGDKHVNDTANHRNEVEYIPRIFKIILQNQTIRKKRCNKT